MNFFRRESEPIIDEKNLEQQDVMARLDKVELDLVQVKRDILEIKEGRND